MKRTGFTLIELLIVIGVIAILAASLVISLNPAERFAQARDATRMRHMNTLSLALISFQVNKLGNFTGIDITQDPKEICMIGVVCEGDSLIDLSILVNEGYISSLPIDPQGGEDPLGIGYQVYLQDNRVGIVAMKMETVYLVDACENQTTLEYRGHTYDIVPIGNQCFFAENLRTVFYRNDDLIPYTLTDIQWENTTSGAVTYYEEDINMGLAYGFLYNWFAVDDARELCPEGWRVPSDDDWNELADYLGDNPGAKLKSCYQVDSPLGGDCDREEHPRWNSGSTYGTDDYNFSGLGSGYRGVNGAFGMLGTIGLFWSSTPDSIYDSVARGLTVNNSLFSELPFDKGFGFSVRCPKNE